MSQQQKSPHEEFIMAFIVVFLVVGISWLIWKMFHVQLTETLRWIRICEMWIGTFLHGGAREFTTELGVHTLDSWRNALRGLNSSTFTPDLIRITTPIAVEPIRIVFVVLLGIMAIYVIFKGPNTKYRRRMHLEDLMVEQAKSFPAITPFLTFDPREQVPPRAPGMPVPKKLPIFAEALSPEEWLAHHEVTFQAGHIDINKAWQALGQQLGRRWQGPEQLPWHTQGLYAAFAYKHVRKRKECDALLHDLARAWTAEGGMKISSGLKKRIRKAIRDPKVGGSLKKYTDQHAYETTVILRCLMAARQEGGVLAPAEFLWLRGQDRALWYPLNNLGRKSYHAEAAGAMVHFTNELIAGQKIPTPRFEDVIKTVEDYMKSGFARNLPEIDPKGGKIKPFKKKKR